MARAKYFEIIRGDTIPVGPYTLKLNQAGIPGGIAGWTIFVTLKADLDDTDALALFTHSYTVPPGDLADASQFYFEVPQSKTADLPPTTAEQIGSPDSLPWLDVQIVQHREAPAEPYVRTARQRAVIYADATRRILPP